MIPAVVLAGGLGTRLRSVVADRPKPMAEVAGKPFLAHILAHLKRQGVARAVLSVGHLHEVVTGYFGEAFEGLGLEYVVEDTPLGTGGAVARAYRESGLHRALVVNGDTWFPFDLARLLDAHGAHGHEATLALTRVEDTGRYGAVELAPDGHTVARFVEKAAAGGPGLINAGCYVLERRLLDAAPGERFSLEADIYAQAVGDGRLGGLAAAAPFIDIGIPEDYRRACSGMIAGISLS